MSRLLPSLLFALLLLSCASGRWERLELAGLRGAAAFPEAKRIVLLEETELRFLIDSDTGRAVVDRREYSRVRVFSHDDSRSDSFGAVHTRGFSEVRTLRARVVSPTGEEQEAAQDGRTDRPVSSYVLYQDARVAALPHPTVPEGGVLERELVLRYLEPRLFGFDLPLDGADPIVTRRIVLTLPPGWQIDTDWRFTEGKVLKREVTPDGSVRMSLELTEVPARPHEPLGVVRPPMLLVRLEAWQDRDGPRQGFEDAKALSRWMHELSAPAADTGPELRAVAARIAAESGEEPEARARAAHRYVCERIQYCAIEIGYGAWRPHAATEVNRLLYGDCKDKAMLLHVLLRELGVSSELALIFSHDGEPRPFGLPTAAGNFNHAILKVHLPRGPVFTDPTAEHVPFGELPPNDLDADVLPITAEGAPLERTPNQASVRDEIVSKHSLHFDPSGNLAGTFEVELHGLSASKWRAALARLRPSEIKKGLCRGFFATGCSLKELALEGAKKGDERLSARARVSLDGVTQQTAGAVLVRASALESWDIGTPRVTRRQSGVRLDLPKTRVGDWRLQLPAGWTAENLAAPVKLSAEFGDYQLSWRIEGGALWLHREFHGLRWSLPPDRYQAVCDFADAIRAAESRPVVLRKGAS